MSTVNPDDRERRAGTAIRPVVFGLAILIQFLAPVLALLAALGLLEPDPGLIIVYVFGWVLIGLGALWVPSARSPYLLAAFILSYLAGLFVVIQLSTPSDLGVLGVVFIAGGYGVAVLLLVLYALRRSAAARTKEIGVDAVATVISAPVTGMVNYVQRQRLTLKFTDQQGVDRFFRVGRTGGGYSPGDTLPIRYDPTRPGSKRAILVNGSGPTLF